MTKKSKETRIEKIERELNPEEDVLVMHWECDDYVTFSLPLALRGVEMPVEEYRKKYAGAHEIVVRYEDIEPEETGLSFKLKE